MSALRERAALDAYSLLVVDVAERVSPSVASLRVHAERGARRMRVGSGSAVLLSDDGLLRRDESAAAELHALVDALADGLEVGFQVPT